MTVEFVEPMALRVALGLALPQTVGEKGHTYFLYTPSEKELEQFQVVRGIWVQVAAFWQQVVGGAMLFT